MGAPSMGHQAALGMGSASPVTEGYEFMSCDIGKQASHVETEGIRGTRSHISENVNEGTYTVGGSIELAPTPTDLDNLLPRILGAAESSDVFDLAETVPEFFVAVDKVAKVYEYAGCKVNKAVFRSSASEDLKLTLEVEGQTETEADAGTFPALTLSALPPYIHHQAVLSLGGTEREVDNLEITIDNALLLDRFHNSQTRTALPEGDRIVTLTCDNPFTADETDLYDIAVAGIAGSVVYTNGAYSLTFTFGKLQAPAKGPTIGGRNQEIPLRLELTARMDGSTPELSVTNDSTG